MEFKWERWEPTDYHVSKAPDGALVLGLNQVLCGPAAPETFSQLHEIWLRSFPASDVLITLTRDPGNKVERGDRQELRIWFGKPFCFRSDHVASGGRNLLVTVLGTGDELIELIEKITSSGEFTQAEHDVVLERNRKHGCRRVLTWRRAFSGKNSSRKLSEPFPATGDFNAVLVREYA